MFIIVCEFCRTTNKIKMLDAFGDLKCESCKRRLKFRRRLQRKSSRY